MGGGGFLKKVIDKKKIFFEFLNFYFQGGGEVVNYF